MTNINIDKVKMAYNNVKKYKSSDKIMIKMIEKYNWSPII